MPNILDKIEFIRSIFKCHGVNIDDRSDLNKLLNESQTASGDTIPVPTVFKNLHIHRIYSGILALVSLEHSNKPHTLKKLLKGDLDFHNLVNSEAKNILFELELAHKLSSEGAEVALVEPDIVVDIGNIKVALACKKIMSPKNLKSIIKKAHKQIKKQNSDFGIIALNIDDLLPTDRILKAKNGNESTDKIRTKIDMFIKNNKIHLSRKIGTDKIIGIIISCTIIAELTNDELRFVNLTDTTFYTNSELTGEAKQVQDYLTSQLSQKLIRV
jgi:hypothetical protein